jgi:phage tail sheath protein FI
MPASHASYVFVEEIDSGQRCTQAVASDTLRALLETWCDHELQWVLYETNTPPLWTQLSRHLRGYLATFWMTGALRGEKPGEAFFVTCDQSTMNPEDIAAGHLICVVGLASVKPTEFVLYRINIHLKAPSTSHRKGMVSLLA